MSDRRGPTDSGLTLPEMLVTIVMFGLVAGAITAVVVASLNHQTEIQNRSQAISTARTALERIDRDVRSAQASPTVTTSSLTLTSIPNDNPPTLPNGTKLVSRRLVYSLAATGADYQLVVNETDTYSNNSTSTLPQRVLVPHVTSTAVFSYNATTYTLTTQLQVQPPRVNKPLVLSDNGVVLRNAPAS